MRVRQTSATTPREPAATRAPEAGSTARDRHFPLYRSEHEHDACGTGFIASIDGHRSHRVVQLALRGLTNLEHRGAVGADGRSADGAGVTVQVPWRLLDRAVARGEVPGTDRLPAHERLGVAMLFLPSDPDAARRTRELVEAAATGRGLRAIGWRVVPVTPEVLGADARDTLPRIEQLLVEHTTPVDEDRLESLLYAARREAEAALRSSSDSAYIVSMSSRTIVYKGLVRGRDLARFYHDLADEDLDSALAVFHERFATNTLPEWHLAQPFRRIAHNGEVNTLLGNVRWMAARAPGLTASSQGREVPALTPVITPGSSDTAALDEALDLLASSGRDLLEAMAVLVPEAWEQMPGLDPKLRAFYQYHACLIEPWDGPAGVVFTDGRVAAACMDRNGLRPARYQRTSDGLVIVGSEVGILELPPGEIVESGRIGPGRMLAVDTRRGRFMNNSEIKRRIADRLPWMEWVRDNLRHMPRANGGHGRHSADHGESGIAAAPGAPTPGGPESGELAPLHVLHGYTAEEIRLALKPMAEEGKAPVGSMGDDAPLSALNAGARPLYTYFRQRFAQVTNPPIDSIRERLVMSLDMYLGPRGSLLEPDPSAAARTRISSPVVGSDAFRRLLDPVESGLTAVTLAAAFDPSGGGSALAEALANLGAEAGRAVRSGADLIVLSDRSIADGQAPVPMLLAVSAVHQRLIAEGVRMRASLVAEAGDARDIHHLAALVGFGAAVVHPWLALATIRDLAEDEQKDAAETRYLRAADAGLLKIMAKMGISCVASYHGAQIFEAIGLSEETVERWFPGTTSRIGGVGLEELARDVAGRHDAVAEATPEKGGWYRYRRGGDYHANEPPVWRALHQAVQDGDVDDYRAYADLVHGRPPTAPRDLLAFASDRDPVDLERVEPVESIMRRFQTGAMSLGSLSAEAHEDIARAMNRIGARSNSGEGGEDPQRYAPTGSRRDANSRIKQIASGRFGVTTGYLAAAEEIEIKMAQGAKPGEGGQLPGHKVSAYIAARRHVHAGTPLISPPPHHDIYSIEDLAQLIYDLRTVNPRARIAVKLVASEGVGTIAAGVAKARADVIHISGADGGTGAAPLSSIKHTGAPWELGLAETQQTLVRNALRDRVTVTTDGGMHTGRDVVKAALLGAERYGFGTAALIALGCKMARQCHSNTCPVGIATQAEELRRKYFGTPEMLIRFFEGVAGEVREILAHLGYDRLDDVIGRSDLLEQLPIPDGARWAGVDLSALVPPVAEGALRGPPLEPVGENPGRGAASLRSRPPSRFDDRVLSDAAEHLAAGAPFTGSYEIRNADRTVGARLSGWIARLHGDAGLPAGGVTLMLTGSAGQSFGAWLVDGVRIVLEGEANDYVGKGMSGGSITIRRAYRSGLGRDTVLAGNTLLYGATGGTLYVAGRVGDRFAVRNSGATAVVEGLGKHGCEYMTGGRVVVLGPTGRNFGAGMSGGHAYVFDEFGDFHTRVNPMLVECTTLTAPDDVDELRELIERHLEHTGSMRAERILRAWPDAATRFWRVAPRIAATPAHETSGNAAEAGRATRIQPGAQPTHLPTVGEAGSGQAPAVAGVAPRDDTPDKHPEHNRKRTPKR